MLSQSLSSAAAVLFLTVGGGSSPAAAQDAKAVTLEVAPGDLGAFRADGMVAMTSSEDGEELIFMV